HNTVDRRPPNTQTATSVPTNDPAATYVCRSIASWVTNGEHNMQEECRHHPHVDIATAYIRTPSPLARQHASSSLASAYARSDDFIATVVPEAIARPLDSGRREKAKVVADAAAHDDDV
ncbi:hypothetical protein VNI00_019318, partial [Paramarasmius palmivorus]